MIRLLVSTDCQYGGVGGFISVVFRLDLQIPDPHTMILNITHGVVQGIGISIMDDQTEVRQVLYFADPAEQTGLGGYDQEAGQDAAFEKTGADGDSHNTGCPHTCRGRQALDRRFFGHKNGAGAQKAQTGNDLCRQSRGIGRDMLVDIQTIV